MLHDRSIPIRLPKPWRILPNRKRSSFDGAWHRRWLLLAAIVAVTTTCPAQTPQSGLEVAPDEVDLEQPPLDAATVEAKVRSLMEAARRAKAQRTMGTPSVSENSDSASMFRSDAVWQPEAAENLDSGVDEIRDRIRVLQRLRARQSASVPAPNALRTDPNAATTDDNASESTKSTAKPDANLDAIEQNLENPEPAADIEEKLKTPLDVQATQLLPTPVNSMALGESLLRTGHFEAALKAFQKVDADKLSASDRTWLDLMMALCQRRTDQLDPAEATLREIANDKSTDYPVQVAKWWLKHTEKMRDLKPRLEQLQADSESLLERSKEFTNDQ